MLTPVLCQTFDYYTCDSSSVMPAYLFETWKMCGFLVELQFPLDKYLKFSQNVFETTISHIMVL